MSIIYYPQGAKIEERNTASGSYVVQTLNVPPTSAIFWFSTDGALNSGSVVGENVRWYSGSIVIGTLFTGSTLSNISDVRAYVRCIVSDGIYVPGDKIPLEMINASNNLGYSFGNRGGAVTQTPNLIWYSFTTSSFTVCSAQNNNAMYFPKRVWTGSADTQFYAIAASLVSSLFEHCVRVTLQ